MNFAFNPYIRNFVAMAFWLIVATRCYASSDFKTQIVAYAEKVKMTMICADVSVITTHHNLEALKKVINTSDTRIVQQPNSTSNALVKRSELSLAMHNYNFYCQYKTRTGSSRERIVTQQITPSRSVTIEQEKGSVSHIETAGISQPICNYNLIIPDRTPKESILKATDLKESDGKLILKSESLEIILSSPENPYTLSRKTFVDGEISESIHYSNHLNLHGIILPQKVVAEVYARNGTLFRTTEYIVTYNSHNPSCGDRVNIALSIPEGSGTKRQSD